MTARRPTEDEVIAALRDVEDPEAPIDIVDLGLVDEVRIEDERIEVVLVPTYRSCPAKSFIARGAADAVGELAPGIEVSVRWALDKTWSPDRLSASGVEALREFGVAVADHPDDVACPHCGSRRVEMDNRFGCAVCKSLFYCPACRNPFEVMRGSLVMTQPVARRMKLQRAQVAAR